MKYTEYIPLIEAADNWEARRSVLKMATEDDEVNVEELDKLAALEFNRMRLLTDRFDIRH